MNFRQQAEQFIKTAQMRRRNPITAASVRKYEASLNHAYPLFGNRELKDINNGAVKVLIAKLATDGLSASTISGVFSVVKAVVASAVDEQGQELHPRTWNPEFIDLPVIDPKSQNAPVMDAQAVSRALGQAKAQDKALVALLAGTGLRIGEAQALYVGPQDSVNSTWDPQTATIYVHSTVINDTEIQPSPKTAAGIREIDLSPELNAFLRANLAPVVGGRMFASPDGGIMCRKAAVLRLPTVPGFHSLRRFRVTHLRKTAPEGLIKFWIGHQDASVTDRYDRIRVDIQARKEFAAKAGLGFSL